MATRFYLPSTGAAAVTPDYSSEWQSTAPTIGKLAAVTTKIGSTMTTVTLDDSNSDDQDICFGMWVSAPLAAQTISAQLLALSVRASETTTSNNVGFRYTCRVVESDGVTYRGTIRVMTPGLVEAYTGGLRSLYRSVTTTEIEVSDGDRLVFEVGMGGNPASAAHHDCSMSFGDDSANDLAADNTDTDADNPWFEFANTLTFLITDPAVSKTESVTAADAPTAAVSTSLVDNTESITAGDAPTMNLVIGINNPESITVTDEPTAAVQATSTPLVDESESITVTDEPTAAVQETDTLLVDESENITVTDEPTAEVIDAGGLEIDASESITIGETVDIRCQRYIYGITVSITVTDEPTAAVQATSTPLVDESESITVTDTPTIEIQATITLLIEESESVTITDMPIIVISSGIPDISIIIDESITITDTASLFYEFYAVNTSENIIAISTPVTIFVDSVAGQPGELAITEELIYHVTVGDSDNG